MPEILGSGKCKCINKDEKDKLSTSLLRVIQIFSERIREDIDSEIKESYRGHIEDFQKLRDKVKNTPEC